MRDNELWSFLPYMTQLNWLHIKHSPQLTSKGLLAISALTKLQHLNLEHCEGYGRLCLFLCLRFVCNSASCLNCFCDVVWTMSV